MRDDVLEPRLFGTLVCILFARDMGVQYDIHMMCAISPMTMATTGCSESSNLSGLATNCCPQDGHLSPKFPRYPNIYEIRSNPRDHRNRTPTVPSGGLGNKSLVTVNPDAVSNPKIDAWAVAAAISASPFCTSIHSPQRSDSKPTPTDGMQNLCRSRIRCRTSSRVRNKGGEVEVRLRDGDRHGGDGLQ